MAGLRSRLKTFLWLKLRLAAHSLRNVAGITEAVVTALMILLGTVLAILLAGTAVIVLVNVLLPPASPGQVEHVYALTFGLLAAFAFVAPFAFGEAKAELDPARLLLFPVTKRELYGVTLGAGALSGANLVWYPALAAVWLTGVIEGWINPLTGLAAALLTAACVAGWQQLILSVFRALLKNRRLRELLAAISMIVLMMIAFLPSLMQSRRQVPGGTHHTVLHATWLHPLLGVLPNRLAARAARGADVGAATALLALAIWTLAAIWLGWRIFSWELERPGAHTSGRSVRPGTQRHRLAALLSWLPPDTGALAAKQVRYLFRSTAGKISLISAPFIALLASVFAGQMTHGILGIPANDLVFLGLSLFAAGLLNKMIFNIFIWDRGGAALYFTTPPSPGRILLGLNTGLAAVAGCLVAETFVTWFLVRGIPGLFVLSSGVLICANHLVLLLMSGNVTSILAPVPRDIGSPAVRASGVSAFVSMGVMTVELVLSGAPLLLWKTPGRPLIPVLLGGVLFLEAGAYWLLLPRVGRLLETRKERLLEALAGTPG